MITMRTVACALGLFGSGCVFEACAAKEMAADAAYGGTQEILCIDPEPILGPSASKDERAAAWSRVEACRLRIQRRWGVAQTFTEAGHD